MKTAFFIGALAWLSAGMAEAGEPVRLDGPQLDSITAEGPGRLQLYVGQIVLATLAAAGEPGSPAKRLAHVFDGILPINITNTLQTVNNTLHGQ